MTSLFMEDVTAAVQTSVRERRPLVVYCAEINDLRHDVLNKVQTGVNDFVAVKLVQGTQEFEFFKQMVHEVVVPAVYVVENGLVKNVVKLDSPSAQVEQQQPQQDDDTEEKIRGSSGAVESVQREVDAQGVSDAVAGPHSPQDINSQSAKIDTESAAEQATATKGQQIPERPCALSFRLLDGSTIQHTFKANDTLNDVRQWLDTESNREIITTDPMPSFARPDALHPTRYAFQSPCIPRTTFDDNEEFMTLKDLNLLPRSVLILKPVFDETVQTAYTSKTGVFKSVMNTFTKYGNAIYSFFDYSLNDEDEEMLSEDSEHRSPKVISIDGKKAKPPTLINFESNKNDDEMPIETEASEADDNPLARATDDSVGGNEGEKSRSILNQPSMTRVQTIQSVDEENEEIKG